jgi:hypothetical protein
MLSTREIQLYEQRIDNCFAARDRCEEDSWGFHFWQKTAMALLRTLNQKMSLYK